MWFLMKLMVPRNPRVFLRFVGGASLRMASIRFFVGLKPFCPRLNPRNSTDFAQSVLLSKFTCIPASSSRRKISANMAKCSSNVLPLPWKISSMYGVGFPCSIGWNTPTIRDWNMSLAGLIPIGSTQLSKNPYWVVMMRSFLDSLHNGIKSYPILRSMTEARKKPLMSCSISSMVGSEYSFRFRHWLILQKLITSLIVPFFFRIPNAGEAYLQSSISSADILWSAPILH